VSADLADTTAWAFLQYLLHPELCVGGFLGQGRIGPRIRPAWSSTSVASAALPGARYGSGGLLLKTSHRPTSAGLF